MVRLEGAVTGHAQVLGLLLSQLGQLHVQLAQVDFSHCLIQLVRQEVNANSILVGLGT